MLRTLLLLALLTGAGGKLYAAGWRGQPAAAAHDLRPPFAQLALIGLKAERRLEVWAGRPGDSRWRLYKSFPFTGFSGTLGPKLRLGDRQIPEGRYRVEYLNPNSRYHLSMKLNYPNRFDRLMAQRDGRRRLGGDIFIHGKDVTVGCIPVGDPAIEELFALAAQTGLDNITVIIAPYDMRLGPRRLAVEGIDWEPLLYRNIAADLAPFR